MNAADPGHNSLFNVAISRQRGVTMIEVLVSVLILSIGLLGLAALQSSSLQFNHSAHMRTVSNNLAYDMADRMRANREAALAGEYDIGYEDPAPVGATVAEDDVAEWRAAIGQSLPSGTGRIAVDPGAGAATIGVRWTDTRGDEGVVTFEMRTRL